MLDVSRSAAMLKTEILLRLARSEMVSMEVVRSDSDWVMMPMHETVDLASY